MPREESGWASTILLPWNYCEINAPGDARSTPLWDTPAPYRSTRNGGPPLEPRSAGRPTIDTPELRDRIFELLCDGMPLRAICRVEGMPARRTVYNWKARDPEFDRQLSFAAQEGCIRLVETISEQFERIVQTYPPKVARRWWNLRLRQLIRVNPRFFGVLREEGRVGVQHVTINEGGRRASVSF